MRVFGSPTLVDLASNGSPTASVTPGTLVQTVAFTTVQNMSVVDGDNWPLASGIVVGVTNTFDQAAAGGSVVNWDELFRTVDSVELTIPNVGTYFKKEFATGPVLKHVIEWISLGYRYYSGARAQISAADGDTTIDLYFCLPFANDNFLNAAEFYVWYGWLVNLNLTVNIATATTIAAVSTGAVTKAPCTIRAWITGYAAREPFVPLINQWSRYTQTASAGATSILLQNVGLPNGLSGVVEGVRLAALVELANKLGFGGASTADNFTAFQSSDLGQPTMTNVDGWVGSFLSQIGHRGPISGVGASTPIHDVAGAPFTMAATPNNRLNDVNLGFLPWRFLATDQHLKTVLKWPVANLSITRAFTATPSSGTHIIYTNEIRQLDAPTRSTLLKIAKIPTSVLTKMRRPTGILGERIPFRD